MRCYDALINEMGENTAAISDPCARQTAKVEYLLEKLQIALRELDQMTGLAEQKADILAKLTDQLRDDLKFQNESVVMSIRRDGKPTSPGVVYTFMVTTSSGNVTMELSGSQFHSIAEIFRLQKLMSNNAQDGLIDYQEVSVCQRDIGTEVTLHI